MFLASHKNSRRRRTSTEALKNHVALADCIILSLSFCYSACNGGTGIVRYSFDSDLKNYSSSDFESQATAEGFNLQADLKIFGILLLILQQQIQFPMSSQKRRYSLVSRLNDGWLRLIGIPVVAFIATFFFYSEHWLQQGFSFGYSYMISLCTATMIWYINRFVLLKFRRRFPEIEDTNKRIFLQFLASLFISALASLLISWFYDLTLFWGRPMGRMDYVYNVFVISIFVFLVSGIYEASFYFARWRVSVSEADELKKANLQSQLESLKNQVSPHFLFNSLNTLSSLIEENQEQAVKFVNQLSRVYRYLLQSNEKELTTVKDELDFLNAYFFLMKTRFGDGLSLEVDLPDELYSSSIPPLTLQILVENAVKHNIVSVSKPLLITITACDDDMICVGNNLQKKTLNVVSNGMGLTNIAAKYKLLNKPAIVIDDQSGYFKVTLPLIKNQAS